MQNANLLLTFARNFFRGSLKSSNKIYSDAYGHASPLKKQERLESAVKAGYRIASLRKHQHYSERIQLLFASDPRQRAGNCAEYAIVALWQGIQLRIPNIWLAKGCGHSFIVLARELPSKMTLNDFQYYMDQDFYVCDPWSGLCCEMHLFPVLLMGQATSWEAEGKEIWTEPTQTQQATKWVQQLLIREASFFRMSYSNGNPTDLYDQNFT